MFLSSLNGCQIAQPSFWPRSPASRSEGYESDNSTVHLLEEHHTPNREAWGVSGSAL